MGPPSHEPDPLGTTHGPDPLAPWAWTTIGLAHWARPIGPDAVGPAHWALGLAPVTICWQFVTILVLFATLMVASVSELAFFCLFVANCCYQR